MEDKKDYERRMMQEHLQMQIAEKERKKKAEADKLKAEEERDDLRVRQEVQSNNIEFIRQTQGEEAAQRATSTSNFTDFSKKTGFANQHSFNIIGSHTGQ